MPTQQAIAKHLDLAQQNVSELMKKLELDWKTATLDEIRIAYIRQLRAQAAGHRTDDGLDLVRERVLTERVDRELKQYTLAEKKGQLVNVAQLEPELQQMFGAFRTELLARDDKLKADIDQLYGIDVDIQVLNATTHDALRHLARYDAGSHCTDHAPLPDGGSAGPDRADGVGAPAQAALG
jgi:hypothetical protein